MDIFVRLLIPQLCKLVCKVWCLIVLLIVEKECLVAKISFKVSCCVPRKLWLVNLKGRTSLEVLVLDGHNIVMDLKETGSDDVYWIHLT